MMSADDALGQLVTQFGTEARGWGIIILVTLQRFNVMYFSNQSDELATFNISIIFLRIHPVFSDFSYLNLGPSKLCNSPLIKASFFSLSIFHLR